MASPLQEELPRIPHSELTDLEAIGQGGFGVAYRAKHPRHGTVVYKKLNAEVLGERMKHELMKEARMCILQHVNIVALFAIIFELGHYGIVMEYVLHGALDEFMYTYEIGWPLKLSFAHGIVCGMNYLHSLQPPVIHSDLKSENILISDRFVAKICDFGLAKWKQQAETQTVTGNRRGTVAYMGPEVFVDPSMSRTTKYDVYGFGILLWELLSGRQPFEFASDNEQIKAAVVHGNRPPLNTITGPDDFVSFAARWIPLCWHQSPQERPSFHDLEVEFIKIIKLPAANPVTRPFLREIKLAQRLQAADVVFGVTQLHNVVYVVCWKSSIIKTYNADTLGPLGDDIHVDGMKRPNDIVVCRDDHQLYVADWDACIWRVLVDSKSYVKFLPTDSSTQDTFRVYTLSVTSRRLLVTSWRPPSLRQYSMTDRQLLRVVQLPGYVWSLLHAVETTRGTFVIVHWGTTQYTWQQAVSEIDVNGRLLSTFTDVYAPWYLSTDSEDHVIVADRGNGRILLLSNQLQLERVLVDTDSQVKLQYPHQLYYNELTSQLYVAHGGHVNNPRLISQFTLR